jgi:hypothetical protein
MLVGNHTLKTLLIGYAANNAIAINGEVPWNCS